MFGELIFKIENLIPKKILIYFVFFFHRIFKIKNISIYKLI